MSKIRNLTSQSGFAPIAIVAVIAIVVLLAGGGFFLASKSGNLPQSPSIPGVPAGLTLNPNCEYQDPDLCKFINNWKQLKDYSATSSNVDEEGKKTESSIEISGEDKFKMKVSEDGKDMMEMITLGDTTYTKDYTDGKWWKQKQEKMKEEIKEEYKFDFEDKPETETSRTEYKKVGKEACGKLQCFKYEVVESQMEGKEYIYFDDKDYLLRKQRSEVGKVYTETEFNYNKPNISEPSPTKELKEGEVAVPGGGVINYGAETKETEKAAKEMEKSMQQNYEKMMQDQGDSAEDYTYPSE